MSPVKIQSRESWGARPPKHKVTTVHKEIYLHHSVGSGMRDKDGDGDKGDDYMKSMQDYHMDGQGWSDIAYNFAIDPDGLEVYEGRGWNVRPGSQKNHNTNTWSVVIMGNFDKTKPEPALLRKIAELVNYGQELGYLPKDAVLVGHKNAPGQSTTCPGKYLYRELDTINQFIQEGGDMAFTAKEEEVLKRMVKEILDLDSNGTVMKHVILHLRNHPSGGGGLTEAQVKQIVRDTKLQP